MESLKKVGMQQEGSKMEVVAVLEEVDWLADMIWMDV
jgi:hypothetical protein